jgi:1-acyl-sn-glycerol-3-phosphate acyltransferase
MVRPAQELIVSAAALPAAAALAAPTTAAADQCSPRPSWRAGLAPLTAPLPHFRRPAARLLCRGLMLTLGRLVEVERRERLAAVPEPAIFALNHSNALEALLAPTALLYLRQGRPLHFLADWMFVEAPGLGWLLRQSEPIAVYGKPARFRLARSAATGDKRSRGRLRERHRRERLRRPVLATCLEHLGRGESIGIFPEGTRHRDGSHLLRGRLGLGRLALAAAVPVVPVAIRYPYGRLGHSPSGRQGRAPRLGRMVLSIGEPLDFAAERRQAAAAPEAARELARHVVDRVMAALAAALDREYRPVCRDRRQRLLALPEPAQTPNRRSEAT